MHLSEKEYASLLKKCPSIPNVGLTAQNNTPKYRNVKVYVYPDGRVSYGEKLEGHGKPVVYDSTKEYDRGSQ